MLPLSSQPARLFHPHKLPVRVNYRALPGMAQGCEAGLDPLKFELFFLA